MRCAEVEPMKGSTGGGTELHIAGAGFAYVTQVGALALQRWCVEKTPRFHYRIVPPSYKLVYKPHEYYSYKYHKP